jgi:uncharacterized protein YbaR (Trm112 family)
VGKINSKSMKKYILALFFTCIYSIALAEIPVYCPDCKTLLYIYQKDEVEKGVKLEPKDFTPVSDSISALKKHGDIVCPLDGAKLNGWEYWADEQGFSSFSMSYQAVSLLTKDKDGNFVWVPYDIPKMDEVENE